MLSRVPLPHLFCLPVSLTSVELLCLKLEWRSEEEQQTAMELSELLTDGEDHIGDESCGTPLVAIGFVGIDATAPTQNY